MAQVTTGHESVKSVLSVKSVVEENNPSRGRRKELSVVENKDGTLPILNDDESDYRYEDIDSSLP